MHFRGLCLGIDETFLLFQDKQNKQMLASKETKKPIHRSGRRATVLSSPQWNTPQNKLTYSWGKKSPKVGRKWSSWLCTMERLTLPRGARQLPNVGSLLQLPGIGAASATEGSFGDQILRTGGLGSYEAPGWLHQNLLPSLSLYCSLHDRPIIGRQVVGARNNCFIWKTSKLRKQLTHNPQRTILPELKFRLLLY